MSPGTCHRCDAFSELKDVSPAKVLCFHLEIIRYAKTLLGSSFSIQKVRIWIAGRQLSSRDLPDQTLFIRRTKIKLVKLLKNQAVIILEVLRRSVQ